MSSRRAPLYSSWGRGRLGSTWSGWWGTPCPACWWSKRHRRGVKPQDSATPPPCIHGWYMRTSRCGLFLLSPPRSRCWRSPCWRRGRRSSWWSSRLHACFFLLQEPGPCVFDISRQFISVLMVLGQDACLSSLGLPYGQNKQNVGKQSASWPWTRIWDRFGKLKKM